MDLYQGDCLELMAQIPDGWVDMVLADLPYGTTRCKWDQVIPFEPMWRELLRITKPRAAICFFASQPFTSALIMSKPELWRHEWVWQKNRGSNYANTVREPMKEHDTVQVFSRGGWTYNKQMQERNGGGASRVRYGFEQDAPERTENYGDFAYKRPATLPTLRVPSSVQKFNCEVGLHPQQKPVPWLRYLIRTYSNPDETVLDFCMGSGSTGEGCRQEGRNFVGIEKDADHFATAANRLAVTV